MPYITSGNNDSPQSVEPAPGPPSRAAIAVVDSEIINAHWRRLHAMWAEDIEELERARAAIDLLLDRRIELMQALAAA